MKRTKPKPKTFERFLVMSGGLYGHYGFGDTLQQARQRWRKYGGKKKEGNYREFRFYSRLQFAPPDRDAEHTEADCWVGRDGSITFVRCEKEQL